MRGFLAILLVLAGCGGHDPANNHGYGFAFDIQGASGMQVRYDPTEVSRGIPQTPVTLLEQFYAEVQACTGLSAPAPFVIFVSNAQLGELDGFYYSDPSLVLVKGLFIFKHEVIHYLLDANTGNLDIEHRSPLFHKCS